MSAVMQAAAVALAVGCAAQIGSSSQVSKPLRMWLAGRKKPVTRWLFDLVSCPFCSSVWLSAAGTGIFRPWLVSGFILLEWGCTFLAVSAASMLPVLWIRKALKA